MNVKIQELYTKLTVYSAIVSNWTLRSFDMWDTAIPKDVTIKSVDASGALVDTVVPNIAKVLANYNLANPGTAGAISAHTINVTTSQELIDAVTSLRNYSLLGPVDIVLAAGVYDFTASIDIINIGGGDAVLNISPAPATSVSINMIAIGDVPLFNIRDSAVAIGGVNLSGLKTGSTGGTIGIDISNSDVTLNSTTIATAWTAIKVSNNSTLDASTAVITGSTLGMDVKSGSIVTANGISISGTLGVLSSIEDGIRIDNSIVYTNGSTLLHLGHAITALNGSKVEAKSATVISRDIGVTMKDGSVGDITLINMTAEERVAGSLLSHGVVLDKKSTLRADNATISGYAYSVESIEGSHIIGIGVTITNATLIGLSAYNGSIVMLDSFLIFPANTIAPSVNKRLISSTTGSTITIDGATITNEVGLKIEAASDSNVLGAIVSNSASLALDVQGKSNIYAVGIGLYTSNIAVAVDAPEGSIYVAAGPTTPSYSRPALY